MPRKYRYVGSAPNDLACGKVVVPGSETTDVNPKDPHDRDLIDRGQLVELKAPAAASAKNTSQEGDQ